MRKKGTERETEAGTERMGEIRGSEIRVRVRKRDRWREAERETEGGRERK